MKPRRWHRDVIDNTIRSMNRSFNSSEDSRSTKSIKVAVKKEEKHLFQKDNLRKQNVDEKDGSKMRESDDVFNIDSYYTVEDGDGEIGERLSAVKAVTAHLTDMGLSDENMKTVIRCAELIWKHNIGFADLKKCRVNVIEAFAKPETVRSCSCCWIPIQKCYEYCQNRECRNFQTKPVRGSASQQTVITTYSIRSQVQKILERQMGFLLETHHFHHFSTNKELNLSSFRLSKKYSENIETLEEFNRQHLKLPAALSFDGFVPVNNSKTELTPLYLRLEGVPREIKEGKDSIILIAMHTGPSGVSSENANVVSNRLVNELQEFKIRPLEVCYENTVYTIELNVVMMITDGKASRLVSGYPNWSLINGCTECRMEGTRIATSAVSFYSLELAERRTREELYSLMLEKHKINGITLIVSPLDQPLDELHLISEGVIKRIHTDLLGRTSHWPELKLPPKIIKSLDECLLKIRNSVNQKSQFVIFSKMGKLTGSQLKQTSRVVLSILAVFEITPDVYLRIFFLVFVRFIDMLMTAVTAEDLSLIQTISNYLKRYIGSRHCEKYTLKTHMLLDHSVQKIAEYGNLSDTSSAPFEKIHRLISVSYNQFSSNPENLANCFLAKVALDTGLKTKDNAKVRLGENISSSSNYQLIDSRLIDDLMENVPFEVEDLKVWMRISVGDKLLNSTSWKRKNGSALNCNYSFSLTNQCVFGAVSGFITCTAGCFAVVTPYKTCNPITPLYYESMAKEVDLETLDLLWNLNEANTWLLQDVGFEAVMVLPISCFSNELVSLHYRGKHMLLESHR